MQNRLQHVWLILSVAAIIIGLLSVGLSDWLHLAPCHLCIFQRLLILVFGGLALAVMLTIHRRALGLTLGILAVCTAIAGASTAGYQSWLQHQRFDDVSCIGSELGNVELFVEWLGQQLPSLFLATGFCEDDGFQILGMSLANWSLISFAAIGLIAAWAIWKSRSE